MQSLNTQMVNKNEFSIAAIHSTEDLIEGVLYDVILDEIVKEAIIENKFSEFNDLATVEQRALDINRDLILVTVIHKIIRHEVVAECVKEERDSKK